MTTKEQMKELIEQQPDDASYHEIMRELAFARMADRGLADARKGRVISNEELGRRIRPWQTSGGQTRLPPGWRTSTSTASGTSREPDGPSVRPGATCFA